MPYSDKSLRKAAMARYEQAMRMPSNPMTASTKDERLSRAINAMKETRDSFQEIDDQSYVARCDGYIASFEARRMWHFAHKKNEEDEIETMISAVKKCDEAIQFFEKGEDDFDKKREQKTKEKSLGIIAAHRMNYGEAIVHFKNGLHLAEELRDRGHRHWFFAAIRETEAWTLVYSRFIDLKNVDFCEIAEKFREAERDYIKALDMYAGPFCDSWCNFFCFLCKPKYENICYYDDVFKTNIDVETLKKNGSYGRKKLKLSAVMHAEPIRNSIYDALYPIHVVFQCNSMVQELERWLNDQAKQLKAIDDRSFDGKNKSIDSNIRLFARLSGVQIPTNLEWAVGFNNRCKHGGLESSDIFEALQTEALNRKQIIFRELKSDISAFKKSVDKWVESETKTIC